MLGIIDYGMGNIFSLQNALKSIDVKSTIVSKPRQIKELGAIILPGVGAFNKAMEKLTEKELIDPILDFSNSGKYLLGICLGMQLLTQKSYEFKETSGLSLVEGSCIKFPNEINNKKLIVPHTMWNKIKFSNSNNNLSIFKIYQMVISFISSILFMLTKKLKVKLQVLHPTRVKLLRLFCCQ